jgi:uncharacterized protein
MAKVESLWCYPVKSLQGTRVSELHLDANGARGDRRRALIDAVSGKLCSAKRHAALLGASATADAILLPDGDEVRFDDPDADDRLSGWLGRPVRLAESDGSVDLVYEMTFDPPDDEAAYFDIPAPAGTFLDLAALHLLGTATLAEGVRRYEDLDWDVRRFRPNVVVDGLPGPFAEDAWCGRQFRIGTAVLAGRQPTVRCAMPLRAQPGLHRQPELFAALDELHANHLGIYVDVVTPGALRVGDAVELVD